jgi:hypothetical protein
LNASWFGNLFEARVKIAVWKEEYSEERPHSSSGEFTATEIRAPQCGEQRKMQVMSSGDFGVV